MTDTTPTKPIRRHVNRSEIVKRKSDGKWIRWEYFSDVDLGIIPFKIAKRSPFFPRRWVITDIADTKQEFISAYQFRTEHKNDDHQPSN